MNWTGGRLQRHSKNNSGALQKQKQHFAAVRQRLQNGEIPRVAPFRPSFLIRSGLTRSEVVSPFDHGSQRHTEHPKARQSRLEDYNSTAPLVRRLASIRNRPARSKKHDHRPRENAPGVIQTPEEAIYNHQEDDQRQRSLSSQFRRTASLSHSVNRTRRRSREGEENLLEVSRKKLLQQRDWVGLAPSRPVQIQFTSQQDKERIGKRRKNDSNIEKRQKKFGKMNYASNHGAIVAAQAPFMSGALRRAPESINVRIGDNTLASTLVSTIHHEVSPPQEEIQLLRHSSETMLFDAEEGVNLQLPTQNHEQIIDHDYRSEYGNASFQNLVGTKAAPDCISGGIESSSRRSDLNDLVEEQQPMGPNDNADAIRLEQLLNEISGLYEDKRGPGHISVESPNLLKEMEVQRDCTFQLLFESLSAFNEHMQSESTQPPPSHVREEFNELSEVQNPLPKGDRMAGPASQFVIVHAAPSKIEETYVEDNSSDKDAEDYDTMWKKILSISSSRSSTSVNELKHEDAQSEDSSLQFCRTSTMTMRDPYASTLKYPQSALDVESSVVIRQSPSASLQNIMRLEKQPTPRSAEHLNRYDANDLWKKFIFNDNEEDDSTTSSPRLVPFPTPLPRQFVGSSLYVGPGTASLSAQGYLSFARSPSTQPKNPTWSAQEVDRSQQSDLAAASNSSLRNNPCTSDASHFFRATPKPNDRNTSYKARTSWSTKNNVSGSNSAFESQSGYCAQGIRSPAAERAESSNRVHADRSNFSQAQLERVYSSDQHSARPPLIVSSNQHHSSAPGVLGLSKHL